MAMVATVVAMIPPVGGDGGGGQKDTASAAGHPELRPVVHHSRKGLPMRLRDALAIFAAAAGVRADRRVRRLRRPVSPAPAGFGSRVLEASRSSRLSGRPRDPRARAFA